MALHNPQLLDYYQRELTYLRKMGVEFARSFPKVARRLELGPDESADAHVERLIESFAFLAARIQRNLESEFPLFTGAMLGILYPQFSAPIPSMAIARFDVDPGQAKLTTGFRIERDTPLFALAPDDLRCRFRTASPVTLWPLTVTEVAIESTDRFDALDTQNAAAVLRLTIRRDNGPIGELSLDKLRFYLNADPILANTLYELMFSGIDKVAILGNGNKAMFVPAAKAIHDVGFADDEALLPYPRHAHPGYRLLQEYFCFPEKFRFFDLVLPPLPDAGDTIDVLFLLKSRPSQRLAIDPNTFALGCTPIINLFPKMAEPIRLTHRKTEYRVVGDFRMERSTEIHSIQEVWGTGTGAASDRVDYAPFFSFNHASAARDQQTFWTARREPTGQAELPGTDIFLSFLNLAMQPERPATDTILINTLCTNRTLAEQLQPSAILQIEEAAPLTRILCLTRPTAPRPPPIGGETAWRLISHLSLNYLSLADGEESLTALREILHLHAPPNDPAADQQIQGLRGMSSRIVTRRVGNEAWRGFCRGNEVTMDFDERKYVGSSAFLFAAVLERFLGLYTNLNSFTELKITSAQRNGIWNAWPPRIGDQKLL